MESAIVLAEKAFGRPHGKTAHGLVRHSLRFKILGVIDSSKAGHDAGELLDGKTAGIPIFASVADAVSASAQKPDYLIVGVATIGGMLPKEFRPIIKDAIRNRIGIISGLHEWLSQDHELVGLAKEFGVTITDIRREPPLDRMNHYRNLARTLKTVRIPILGTDAATGKRTTGIQLVKALKDKGIRASFVATGQTGLLQGSRFGIPLDAIRGDYVVGELENAIVEAYKAEKPQVIIIEGQGALSHPAYVTGSRAIVQASAPSTVVLMHAPGRKYRTYHMDELRLPNGTIDQEMELVRVYAGCDIIALAISHENMTRKGVQRKIFEFEKKYRIPACDPLVDGADKIADAIIKRYFSKKKPARKKRQKARRSSRA